MFHLALSCLESSVDLEVASACLHGVLQTTGEKWECGKSALALRAGAPERAGGDRKQRRQLHISAQPGLPGRG